MDKFNGMGLTAALANLSNITVSNYKIPVARFAKFIELDAIQVLLDCGKYPFPLILI
jgi:hypothetical protein